MTPEQKLIDLRAYAEQNDVPILTPEAENVFIAMLKASGAKRILEVGTAIGYSGTVSLLVTEDSHLFTIEIDEERAEMARKTFADFELTPRVTQFIGDAGDILQK
ncbi:MAG: O-methyltransferase, partial [Clostridia bacterium]|nr:O-methyltransferase [Clostridia bacterium]